MIWRVISWFAGFLLGCFLALFGEFFPAFLSVNEHVIRVTYVVSPLLPDFAEAVPILKLIGLRGFEEFLVHSACSSWTKLGNSLLALI
jgi:hypothetical protein